MHVTTAAMSSRVSSMKGNSISFEDSSEAPWIAPLARERSTWAMKRAKLVAHYGFIPLIILISPKSSPRSEESPILFKLVPPLVSAKIKVFCSFFDQRGIPMEG